MIRRFTIVAILTIGALGSCEEVQKSKIDSEDTSLLVVEALITNENKRHEVKLSQTFDELSDSPPMVANAWVVLNDGTTNMILEQDPNRPGIYLTDSLRAIIGKLYTLFIIHEEKEYFAVTAANVGAPIEPLIVVETTGDTLEYIYQESAQPSMMEVEIIWDELDTRDQLVKKEVRAFFYTLNVIDVNQIFAPNKEKIFFPRGAQVSRKKYSLTQDHQEFLRSFLSEVDWRGGSFDVAPGNVKTNLSEGAVGYFAVSMVQSDVAIVN